MPMDDQEYQEFAEAQDRFTNLWRDKPLDELVARRAELHTRTEALRGYQRRSQPQETEFVDGCHELVTLDGMIGERHASVRSQQLDRVRQAAADPSNREAGAPTTRGAPALVGRAHRETVRTRSPWAD